MCISIDQPMSKIWQMELKLKYAASRKEICLDHMPSARHVLAQLKPDIGSNLLSHNPDVNQSSTNLATLQKASDKTGHVLPISVKTDFIHERSLKQNNYPFYRTLVHHVSSLSELTRVTLSDEDMIGGSHRCHVFYSFDVHFSIPGLVLTPLEIGQKYRPEHRQNTDRT